MLVGKVTGVPSPVALFLVFTVLLEQLTPGTSQRQKSKEEELYEKRPYKFQFNIEDHHHRKEEKNDKGIIMGEFGFVTADFFYLTTVYATDEEGKFRILSRSRKYIGPPTEKPPTRSAALPNRPAAPTTPPPPPPASPPSTTKKPGGPFSGLIGCGSCVVPTTTKRPSPGSNLNAGERPSFPGTGIKPPGGQGAVGVLPPTRPGTLGQSQPTRPGAPIQPGFGRPSTPFGPGIGSPNKPGSINPNNGGSPGTNLLPGSRPGDRSQNTIGNGPQGLGGSVLTPGDKGGPHYKFNYTVGFHGHHETGYKGGSKEGGYYANYRDGEGQKVVYEANEFGYQPNVTKVRLSEEETPKIETEKDFGLKGYEFKWFN